MSEYTIPAETEDSNALINSKLRLTFDGRIVRKDLTKKIKEGARFMFWSFCWDSIAAPMILMSSKLV